MRRDIRRKQMKDTSIIVWITAAILILVGIIAYAVKIYRDDKERNSVQINDESIAILEKDDYEEASTEYGKSVEESKNEISSTEENTIEDIVDNEEISNTSVDTNTDVTTTSEDKEEEITSIEVEENTTQETSEEKEEISFFTPVKGEIIREFAQESLVYSETLQEWITHNGVDVKADKTTVVTSAARGKVYAIKNDPRYGLTVIINHNDGYQTVYSNLLTAEFVVEGEEVEQGQTIGTVGATAAFEISDDYHLHFELLKDNQYIDPTIYMSFE